MRIEFETDEGLVLQDFDSMEDAIRRIKYYSRKNKVDFEDIASVYWIN